MNWRTLLYAVAMWVAILLIISAAMRDDAMTVVIGFALLLLAAVGP